MNIQTFLRIVLCMGGLSVAAAATAQPAASVDAPATAPAGSRLPVKWTGPGGKSDRIGIVPAGSSDTEYPSGQRGSNSFVFHNPVDVTVPEPPGDYEVRYYSNEPFTTLARRKLTVLPVTASLDAPASAVGGTKISIRWTGPDNGSDTIVIVPASTPEHGWDTNSASDFTDKGNPLWLRVPEKPGDYQLRYLTGGSGATLARAPLKITSVGSTLSAPASVVAGTKVKVTWTGPGGEFDRLMISVKGSPDRKWVINDFANKGSPLTLTAPPTAGDYELRYETGELLTILARADLKVTPAQVEAGFVRVTAAEGPGAAPGSVEVILDASGSMLQKLGKERRIDIARRTLTTLTSQTIPAGTPFALRVLGRGSDTCQSELEIPFGPLDRTAAAAKLAALKAKKNAKTPLGSALEKITSDLSAAKGERLVILVTDGEETCGGNPARTIRALKKSGVNVRVNIVGFAVDDEKVAATFELWSDEGGGSYFDARDAKGLNAALSLAVKPAFEITDAQKNIVAKGLVGSQAVRLLPGSYTVTLKGPKAETRSVTVKGRETSTVSF